jgi:tetratricopeptide (TPR) repeat protein
LAVEFIGRAIRIDPSNPFFHDNLGTVYQALNSLDEAADFYQKVLELEPGYAGTHFNLGNVFKRQGQPDKAAACFQKAGFEVKHCSSYYHRAHVRVLARKT